MHPTPATPRPTARRDWPTAEEIEHHMRLARRQRADAIAAAAAGALRLARRLAVATIAPRPKHRSERMPAPRPGRL